MRAVLPRRSSAWSALIDRLAGEILGAKLQVICPAYNELDFPNRFAILVGATNGGIFDHIDPSLNIFESGYRRWRNISSAQIPELFNLIRNPRILDVVEALIGQEISATPLYHVKLKKLFHASTQNETIDSYRLAFNMRYLPIGHRNARPFLPAFVARSRTDRGSELTDAHLWADYWDAALDYLVRYERPLPNVFALNARQVDEIEQKWHKLVPGQNSWPSLHKHGSAAKAIRSRVRCVLGRVHGRMASLFSNG
jgi:hypothetical protein